MTFDPERSMKRTSGFFFVYVRELYKCGFAVVFRLGHCEKRIVQVLIAKELHNYDFLLLHKEHEVLGKNHS